MIYRLRLFVTGRSAISLRAERNLRALCERELRDRYELEVIDILDNPQAAAAARILATPTLLKLHPQPRRIIIGDLSDDEKILMGLGLVARPTVPHGGPLS
jgi:circadian clock protein KaiB